MGIKTKDQGRKKKVQEIAALVARYKACSRATTAPKKGKRSQSSLMHDNYDQININYKPWLSFPEKVCLEAHQNGSKD